jgi:hypothetical protein
MRPFTSTIFLLAASAAVASACTLDDPDAEAIDAVYLTSGTGVPLPGAPANVRIESTAPRSLLVAFDDVAGDETGFSVQRYDFGTWNEVAHLPAMPGTSTTGSAFDTTVDSEQDYCYRVRSLHPLQVMTSQTTCGRTDPPAFPYPSSSSSPLIDLITHPAPGTLAVRWIDNSDAYTWTVDVRATPGGPLVDSIPVQEPAGDTNPFQTLPLDLLDPSKTYCFTIRHGISSSNTLCAAPSAARTSVTQRDPDAPHVDLVAAPAGQNGQLRIVLSSPQPGQVLERFVQGVNRRATRKIDTQGASELTDSGLEPGKTYCYYVWVKNGYGTRYSNTRCATPTFITPSTPQHFRVASIDDHDVQLAWDSADYAADYELHFHGERPAYQTKDGDKTTTSTSYGYEMSNKYTYCFKVRARNSVGVSPWSQEICDITPTSSETSYNTSLVSDTPPSGFQLYSHTVNPGGSAHLTRVHVAGNGVTYAVHFLPPSASREDCNDLDVGVLVDSGDDLDSDGLDDLYGSDSPATPVVLRACKMWKGNSPPDNNPMPIQVYFEP